MKTGTEDAAGVDMHPGQLAVSPGTVRELVDAQFPQWRALAIKTVDSQGTVNAIFRVGDHLGARLPLEPGDPELARRQLECEARAARELAGRTRFPTPEPVALGEPGAGYPLPWLVQTWLPGVTATDEDPGGSATFAHDLAEFISGIRGISTEGRTFSGSGRGGNLASHDAWMQTCFARSGQLVDVPRLRRMWDVLRELPRSAGGDVMSHGDLVPGNVLVSGGRLAGVLDVGGLGPADPALDLVAAWHLLEAGPRQVFRDDLGCEDLDWDRGKAWASRLGQMIAVAALPLAAGLSGTDFEDPAKLAAGFPIAMTIAAGASFVAALLAWTTIRDDALSRPGTDTTPVTKELPPSLQRHCAVAGTPLATSPSPRPSSRPPAAKEP